MEHETGSPLRAVDFVFRSPGVNRPLCRRDDDIKEITHTLFYRDQINKVANAVKEILMALKSPSRSNQPAAIASIKSTLDLPVKKIGFITLSIVVLFLAVYFFYARRSEAPLLEKSIAVLPFSNMSGDSGQDYLGDGLSEELINVLATSIDLRVIARTSAFAFKGKNIDLKEIGTTLGVTYALEGSIRRFEDKLRVAASLINIQDGTHIWSKSYDRKMNDILAIQSEIALDVASALKATLVQRDNTAAFSSSEMKIYNLLQQARYYYRLRTRQNLIEAIKAYKEVLTLSPHEARAMAGLADVYTAGVDFNMGFDEGYAEARDLALKAIALNSELPEANVALGWIAMNYEWKWRDSEKNYLRALELNPQLSAALNGLSVLYSSLGEVEKAIAFGRQALYVDPLRFGTYSNLGFFYTLNGNYFSADSLLRKVINLNPKQGAAHFHLALTLKESGKMNEAREVIKAEAIPAFRNLGTIVLDIPLNGKKKTNQLIDEFIKDYGYDGWFYQTAQLYACNNEPDSAFTWLDRAYKNRDAGLASIKADILIKNLASDPRYAMLLHKLNLR